MSAGGWGDQLPGATGPVSMAGLSPVAAVWLPTEQGEGLLRLSLSHLDHRLGTWPAARASWVSPQGSGSPLLAVTVEVKWGAWVGTGGMMTLSAVAPVGQKWEAGDLGPVGYWSGVTTSPSSTSIHRFLPPSFPLLPSSPPTPPSHCSLHGHHHLHQPRSLLPIRAIPATTL